MKKIFLTLLSLVLICTMSIGFVACDKDEDTPPTPPEPETISLWGFAKGTEFSFGEFQQDVRISPHIRHRGGERYNSSSSEATSAAPDPAYDNHPVLLLEEDVFFEPTIEKLQTMVDVYLQRELIYYGEYSEEQVHAQKLIDFAERKNVFFQSMFVGKYSQRALDWHLSEGGAWGAYSKRLNMKENDEFCVFYELDPSPWYRSLDYDSFYIVPIEFQIHKFYKKSNIIISMLAGIELIMYKDEMIYPELRTYYVDGVSRIAYDESPEHTEELYEMGKPYFDIMEEVIDAWFKDPRGQAYINKYAQ